MYARCRVLFRWPTDLTPPGPSQPLSSFPAAVRLDASASSYDQEVYAHKGDGDGLCVRAGSSQDSFGKHFESLEGRRSEIDSQHGLSEGFSGGMGEYDNRPGQGFKAATNGACPRGGTNLDSDAGHFSERHIESVAKLGDKLKGECLRA